MASETACGRPEQCSFASTASGDYPSKAGLTGLPPGIASTGFPDISFSGNNAPVSWDGTNSHAYDEAQNTVDIQNNLLWTRGRHNVTFGFQWQTLQDNENTPLTGTQAGLTFNTPETDNLTASGTAISTTCLAYASFLLGLVDGSTVTQNATRASLSQRRRKSFRKSFLLTPVYASYMLTQSVVETFHRT